MIENKKIQKWLFIAIIIMIIIAMLIKCKLPNTNILEIISNIVHGIIGSLFVSYIIARITCNYKKEENMEILIKNLIDIYSKMVIFKCEFFQSQNKNEKIVNLQYDINECIANIHDIEYELVNKVGCIKKENTIVLYKYNEKAVIDISNGIEVNNGKIINNASGLKNQKEFIEAFNKLLERVR